MSQTLVQRHKQATSVDPCTGAKGMNESNEAYMQGKSCAQSQKRLRRGTESIGRPLFIQESGLTILHMCSLHMTQWH
jgi:hypothetical protein